MARVKLADIVASTPPVTSVPEWAEAVIGEAFNAFEVGDFQKIMRRQVELAMAGNPNATKFVTQFLMNARKEV